MKQGEMKRFSTIAYVYKANTEKMFLGGNRRYERERRTKNKKPAGCSVDE